MLSPSPTHRTKLPSGSPSSARLRRLAPCPVKIPPTPPLVNHTNWSFAKDTLEMTLKPVEDPFEFDFMPLEQSALQLNLTTPSISTFPQRLRGQPADSTPPMRVTRQDSTDSNVSIPLLFDARGDFGMLAEKHRQAMTASGITQPTRPLLPVSMSQNTLASGISRPTGRNVRNDSVDVPDEMGLEWCIPVFEDSDNEENDLSVIRRRGTTSIPLTSGMEEVLDRPAPVLVDFNQVVFSKTISGDASPRSKHPLVLNSPQALPRERMSETLSTDVIPQDDRDDSFAESNYTFGRPGKQDTILSVHEDDDGWSYTLSAYGDDDGEGNERHFSSPQSLRGGALRMFERETTPALSPHIGRSESPMSVTEEQSELFTPNYAISPLPRLPIETNYDGSPIPHKPLPNLPQSPKTGGGRSRSHSLALCPTPDVINYSRRQYMGTLDQTPGPDKNAKSATAQGHKQTPARTGKGSASSERSDPSFPEIIRQALQSIPKNTTVSLMIDQEGSREILTTLYYKKIHKPQEYRDKEIKALESAALWCESPSRPEPFQQTGCIEFGAKDPKKRPEWILHHAALEGLPVFRRCYVNQNEKYDYIGRAATLQIRDLGVYAVYGSEDRGRVEWKFEYLVQESISKSTGEVRTNEKKVVPLGFYASPSYFSSNRALKLNLVNIFKRHLVPNLISEKVMPPRIGKPPPGGSTPTPPPPLPSSAMSRTFDAIARAVGSTKATTSTPTPVIASNKPLEKKGRKRAATLFSRSRPDTASECSSPQIVVSPSVDKPKSSPTSGQVVKPMKSMSAISARPYTSETSTFPGCRRGLVPMKSLTSMNRPQTAQSYIPPVPITPSVKTHPFTTYLKPLGRPATSTGAPMRLSEKDSNVFGHGIASDKIVLCRTIHGEIAQGMKIQAKGGFNGPRSNSEDSLNVPGNGLNNQMMGKPNRPELGRRRPSTAEPRLRVR